MWNVGIHLVILAISCSLLYYVIHDNIKVGNKRKSYDAFYLIAVVHLLSQHHAALRLRPSFFVIKSPALVTRDTSDYPSVLTCWRLSLLAYWPAQNKRAER